MKKWGALLLSLMLVAVVLTGCGEQDPTKVVVAEVDGVAISKAEAQKAYDWLSLQTAGQQAQQGNTLNLEDKQTIAQMKANVLGILSEGVALEHQLNWMGHPLTAEDYAQIKQSAQENYDMTVDYYITNYGDTREEAIEYLKTTGNTVDAFEYSAYRVLVEERLKEYADLGVTVTDEEAKTDYDAHVQEATTTYTENPSQFVTDVMNGTTVYARPEGFRYVKNLVIGLPEEATAQINEKRTELSNMYMEMFTIQGDSGAVDEMTEEQKAEYDAKMDDLNARMTKNSEEQAEIRTKALEEIKPEAEAVLEKVKAEGADFDALMAEYNDDTATGDLLTKGYPVAAGVTSYVQSFTDGAMALANIGDTSDLIQSDYGYHILKYEEDIPAGAVAYEEIKADIEAHLKEEKELNALNTKMVEWINQSKIKTYVNRF